MTPSLYSTPEGRADAWGPLRAWGKMREAMKGPECQFHETFRSGGKNVHNDYCLRIKKYIIIRLSISLTQQIRLVY